MSRLVLLACALCQAAAFRCPAARRPVAIASARGRATMRVAPRLDDPAEEPWFDEPDADEAARDAALDAVARAWRLPPPRDDEADDELPVLDRSMFDLTNDSWFANLVRDDYYLAETIYAGGFIACMMMVSQALVRYLLFPH